MTTIEIGRNLLDAVVVLGSISIFAFIVYAATSGYIVSRREK